MKVAHFGQLQDAWEELDDLIDITLVLSRMMTSSGERYTLDEVLAHFGYTREALAESAE